LKRQCLARRIDGARPLKRAIQTLLENPLAEMLLAGEYASGDVIDVDAAEGSLVFDKALQGEIVD